MFGKKEKQPENQPKEILKFDSKLVSDTQQFLLRNLKWYLDQDCDDPDYIAQVTRIVEALKHLENIGR